MSVNRLLVAKGLRGFGDGFVSLLLPLYLLELGFTPLQVGLVATTTLFGSGVLTLLVGLHAWRFRYRSLLLAATLLMAATGMGFAVLRDFWPLMLLALVGTLIRGTGTTYGAWVAPTFFCPSRSVSSDTFALTFVSLQIESDRA